MVDDLAEPAWVVSTRAKAMAAAKRTAKRLGVSLAIYDGAGQIQETMMAGGVA